VPGFCLGRSSAFPVRAQTADRLPAGHGRLREAQDAVTGLDEALRLNPDLITVDISLNESTNGIEFVKNIRTHLENTRILVVSMHDESIYALRVLRAGAQGYLMKQEVLVRVVEALRTVAGGEIFLSDGMRQQVLTNLASGKHGQPVARRFAIRPRTGGVATERAGADDAGDGRSNSASA